MQKPENKPIAFIGYHNSFFWPFFERLRDDGFDVFWINSDPVATQRIRNCGISAHFVCDVLEGKSQAKTENECNDILSEYEQVGLPTIKSIIFMDQYLRNAPYLRALQYLAETAQKTQAFLQNNNVRIVSSGRDTALQMMTMLVCKKLGIFWGCVTRLKIPKERFGFSPDHHGDSFYKLESNPIFNPESTILWLKKYREDITHKPLAKPKISGFDIIFTHGKKIIPLLLSFLINILKSRKHKYLIKKIPGQTLKLLLGRYMHFLKNYIYYRFFLKFDQPNQEPFVLYGLHRQPESSIDVRGAFFDNQLALIKQIVRSTPVSHKIYVKMHFSDVAGQSASFYKTLRSYPGVKIIDPDINSKELVQRASIVVTNAGAMGQEAGYMGRPAIAMSKMFWCSLPTVKFCATPEDLPELIYKMINSPPDDNFNDIARNISEYNSNSVPCDPCQSYLGIDLSKRDLDIMSALYKKLYSLYS